MLTIRNRYNVCWFPAWAEPVSESFTSRDHNTSGKPCLATLRMKWNNTNTKRVCKLWNVKWRQGFILNKYLQVISVIALDSIRLQFSPPQEVPVWQNKLDQISLVEISIIYLEVQVLISLPPSLKCKFLPISFFYVQFFSFIIPVFRFREGTNVKSQLPFP